MDYDYDGYSPSVRMCHHKKLPRTIKEGRTFSNLKIPEKKVELKPDEEDLDMFSCLEFIDFEETKPKVTVTSEVKEEAPKVRQLRLNKNGKFNTAYELMKQIVRAKNIKIKRRILFP